MRRQDILGRSSRRIALALALATTPLTAHAALPGGCDPAEAETRILVRAHDVRNDKGHVTLVLYGDNPDDFLAKGKRLARVRVPAHAGTVAGCIEAPGPGRYALAIFHDEDDNKKLGQNVIGLPTEGYGFSNNARVLLGPPAFDDVVFKAAPGETPLDVKLRY